MKSHPTQASTGKDSSWLRSAGTLRSLAIALLVLLAAASNASAQVTGGTWTAVAAQFPGGYPDQSLLLTDGTVIVQHYFNGDWWRLKPDQYGNYSNGTWKQIASLPAGYAPFAYGAAVLINGNVIVEGGEFVTSPTARLPTATVLIAEQSTIRLPIAGPPCPHRVSEILCADKWNHLVRHCSCSDLRPSRRNIHDK